MYFRDSGVLHQLLRIQSMPGLRNHDRLGASWEGFALQQVIQAFKVGNNCFFWRTHAGSEIDLVIPLGDTTLGFEFKTSTNPKVSKGTHEAFQDLGLDKIYVMHPGASSFPITNFIQALPMTHLPAILEQHQL